MRVICVILFGVAMLSGCFRENTPKASLFEHDHEVAQHWPDDLADAVVKIRERLARKDNGSEHEQEPEHSHPPHGDSIREILEIVSWVPEIAADTNLSEKDWIPLDNAAETLSANLRISGNQWSESDRKQVEAFCHLIEQSIPKILNQHPSQEEPFP